MSKLLEKHVRIGRYLKDVVFAANDGIITTFAVVAGSVGADLSVSVLLIIGLASMIADGFSMATGNYLGTKSEQDFYRKEEKREWAEVEKFPEEELNEIRAILANKGYQGEDLEQMIKLVSKNKQYWVSFMMHEELSLLSPDNQSPVRHGAATFFSFIIAGALPLLPYILFPNGSSFLVAAIASGAALFTVGAARKYFSDRSWLISGMEMLVVGGSAAIIAYGIGFVLKSFLQ